MDSFASLFSLALYFLTCYRHFCSREMERQESRRGPKATAVFVFDFANSTCSCRLRISEKETEISSRRQVSDDAAKNEANLLHRCRSAPSTFARRTSSPLPLIVHQDK
ncbi:hypothetical protein PVAP13_8KG176001 [Panicum virgatum]|uniref:Secreted protein n=1 Tax=Panicum virgatum TaxID=38727 RepID=A0A8T0PW80_PANVG|nr:hypothetical protein PVAP13_8KG176001 [Panicum virgatum]